MLDPTPKTDHPPTLLEVAVRHDRAPLAVSVVVIPLLSWAWIVV